MLTEQEVNNILSEYKELESLKFKAKDMLNCKNSNKEFVLRDILEWKHDSHFQQLLNRLDRYVKNTKKYYSLKRLKEKIISSPFSTCWELELADYFISKSIEFAPDFCVCGKSNVDFRINLTNKCVLVEASVMRLKEKEIEAPFGYDPQHDLPRYLQEKFKQNNIPSNLGVPLIFAIDGEYNGLNEFGVDSFFDSDNNKDDILLVSGILLKNREYKLILNTKAKNPLSKEQIDVLKETPYTSNEK